MTTILEEESDEEDHITNKQLPIKQESEEETSDNTEGENLATQEEMPQSEEVPPRRDTIQQESRIQRRGERQRHKTYFYGQNVMISNIESPNWKPKQTQTERIPNTYFCLSKLELHSYIYIYVTL